MSSHDLSGGAGSRTPWDQRWAPYDDQTYEDALTFLPPRATVLDIGAGDLRFARQMAEVGHRVIAIEQRTDIALHAGCPPDSIELIIADARRWPFPTGVEAAVLLMRHCQDFSLYAQKLRSIGCPVLITNARWGLHVERVPLALAHPFDTVQIGWWGCVRCGATGFVPGPSNKLPSEIPCINVEGCSTCREDSQA